MKWCLVLLVTLTCWSSQAQTSYFQDNQIWDTHYSYYYLGISCATQRNTVYYVNGDTNFIGNTYKRIGRRYEESYTQFSTYPCNSPFTAVNENYMYLRQTNDSIMFYDPWFGTEYLFIDYNVNVGDTFELTSYYVLDTFVVEAISNITINTQNHRVFHVDTANNHQIIEGVGFVGPEASEVFQPIHFNWTDDYYALNCYAQNSVTEWTNPIYPPTSCEYLFYLDHEEFGDQNVRVFPNPSDGKFTLDHLDLNSTIEIYALNGQLLFSKISNTLSIELDLSDYDNGMYLLKLSTGDAKARYVKLVKD